MDSVLLNPSLAVFSLIIVFFLKSNRKKGQHFWMLLGIKKYLSSLLWRGKKEVNGKFKMAKMFRKPHFGSFSPDLFSQRISKVDVYLPEGMHFYCWVVTMVGLLGSQYPGAHSSFSSTICSVFSFSTELQYIYTYFQAKSFKYQC